MVLYLQYMFRVEHTWTKKEQKCYTKGFFRFFVHVLFLFIIFSDMNSEIDSGKENQNKYQVTLFNLYYLVR